MQLLVHYAMMLFVAAKYVAGIPSWLKRRAIFDQTNPIEDHSPSFRFRISRCANGVATRAPEQVFIIARHLDFRRS
jgi:hypothetical protein